MGRSIECADPFYLMKGVRRAHPARAIDVTKQPRTARLLQYRAVAVTAAMLVSTTAVTPGLGQLRRERNSAVQYAQFCDPKERSDAADAPRIYCLDDIAWSGYRSWSERDSRTRRFPLRKCCAPRA